MSRCLVPSLILVQSMLLGMTACRSQVTEAKDDGSRNLLLIRDAYHKAHDKLGRPPGTLEELTAELEEGADAAKTLRSPIDGQDYVIHLGVNLNTPEAPVLAYEKAGKAGMRSVLRGHAIFTLNDEEFKKLRFPPGHTAPF